MWQVVLMGLWTMGVVGVYYLQLWRLIARGPAAWVCHGIEILSTLGPAALVAVGAFIGMRRVQDLAAQRGPHAALAVLPTGVVVLTVIVVGPFTSTWALPGFPAFGEAAVRALRGIAGAAAVLAAATVLGEGVLRLVRWRSTSVGERVLFRTGCGLGAVAYLSLGLAASGFYRASTLRVMIGVLTVVGILWAAQYVMRPRRVLPFPPAGAGYLWTGVLMVAFVVAAFGGLAPEKEYDAVWYHLAFPQAWLSEGRLLDFPTEYVAMYPMTWELLFGAAMAAGGPVASKLLHFSCLALGALLTGVLTRRFAPRASATLAAALFVTAPTVLWEATTAYIDLALTMHIGLGLYAALRHAETRELSWGALAAINLGLSLATKHLGFFALVLAVISTAIIMLRSGRRAAAALAAAALLAIASLTLALPWYIRSWMATGNPVFPEFHQVFGAPAERWDAAADDALNRYEAQFGRPRTPISMLTLPWDLSIHAARYGGTLGPLFLILLPALLILGPGAASMRTLAALAAGYTLLWASPISNFQIRFLIPVSPLLSVIAADAYGRLDQRLRDHMRARHVLIAGTTVLLLLNLPPNLPLHERDRGGFSGWLTHVIDRIPLGVVTGRQTEHQYLLGAVRSYGGWQYINAHLPENSLVLTFTSGDNLYSRRPRLWVNAVAARPATWGAPPGADAAALRALRRLGVTHILFDKRELQTASAETLAIAQSSFLARWAHREYEDRHVVLHRLH